MLYQNYRLSWGRNSFNKFNEIISKFLASKRSLAHAHLSQCNTDLTWRFHSFALGYHLPFHLDSTYGLCSGKFLPLQWEISVTSASGRLPWLPPSLALCQHSLAYCHHCLKLAPTLHLNFKNRFDLTCPFNSNWNKGHQKLK